MTLSRYPYLKDKAVNSGLTEAAYAFANMLYNLYSTGRVQERYLDEARSVTHGLNPPYLSLR